MRRHLLTLVVLVTIARLAVGMPRDLLIVGKSISCTPIVNFYARDGQIFPDYINEQDGAKSSDTNWRAAFWCKSPKSKTTPYWLVFTLNGQPYHQNGCDYALRWKKKPKGLRIHDSPMPLRNFFDLASEKPVDDTGYTKYPPISDTYGGSGYVFYCHNRRWLYAPLD